MADLGRIPLNPRVEITSRPTGGSNGGNGALDSRDDTGTSAELIHIDSNGETRKAPVEFPSQNA
jgi:hypothetical protein